MAKPVLRGFNRGIIPTIAVFNKAQTPPGFKLKDLVAAKQVYVDEYAELGWRRGAVPLSISVIAIMIGLGHSLLAMRGEESLAQVNREIAHPKLKNLERAGFVIFVYSMLFTSLVSFFAVMLIPDSVRPQYLDNLIGGLSMYLAGPVRSAERRGGKECR